MTVSIVTDSTSDIPPKVAQELGITVIPLYIYFGDEVYVLIVVGDSASSTPTVPPSETSTATATATQGQ